MLPSHTPARIRTLIPFLLSLAALHCGARTPPREPNSPSRDSGLDVPAPRDVPNPIDVPVVPIDTIPLSRDVPSVDVPSVDVPPTDAPDPCAVDPTPLRGPLCQRPILAEMAVLSCPGGFVDVVAQGPGTLVWECDGDRAEARFGDRTYRGTRAGDFMSLCTQTEFDYVDGCRWRSSQRLEGDASTGALALTYREAVVSGNTCFPSCSADARVVVQ